MQRDTEDDGFTSIPSNNNQKRSTINQRVILGNLPPTVTADTVQELVRTRLHADGGVVVSCTLQQQQQQGTQSLVSIPQQSAQVTIDGISLDRVIVILRGLQVNGRTLAVSRDKNAPRNNKRNDNSSKTFNPSGAPRQDVSSFGGWNRPKKQPSLPPKQCKEEKVPISTDALRKDKSSSAKEASTDGSDCETPHDTEGKAIGTVENDVSFAVLCQKPLSLLIDDYGEQDFDWMTDIPTSKISNTVEVDEETHILIKEEDAVLNVNADVDTINRLQRQGKAPIHVEFYTFGYRHGIPSEVRVHATCHSHRQPLLAFDTRNSLAEVPHYLAWMDGLSGAVKMAMIRHQPNAEPRKKRTYQSYNDKEGKGSSSRSTVSPPVDQAFQSECTDSESLSLENDKRSNLCNVRDYARDVIAALVAGAVEAAMEEHGYAHPLNMTIFIGSSQGRHRSVVAGELAATAVRKLLRENVQNRFVCEVSVGCRHRDIDRNPPMAAANGKTSHPPSKSKTPRRNANDDDE